MAKTVWEKNHRWGNLAVHDWFTFMGYSLFMSHHDPSEPEMQTSQQRYHTILLRYWREDQTVVWRYMLQDLGTGEQYCFANVDLLVAFLYQQMESQAR